jgi:hypothetical protein
MKSPNWILPGPGKIKPVESLDSMKIESIGILTKSQIPKLTHFLRQ